MVDLNYDTFKGYMSRALGNRNTSLFLAIVFSLFVWRLDFPTNMGGLGFDGINFSNLSQILNNVSRLAISFITIVGILIAYFTLTKNLSFKTKNILLISSIQIALYTVLGALGNLGALLHLIMPWLIITFAVGDSMDIEDKAIIINLLYLFDFVIYAFLNQQFKSLEGIRIALHPFILVVATYGSRQSESQFLRIVCNLSIIGMVFMGVAFFGGNVYAINQIGKTDMQDVNAAKTVFEKTGVLLKDIATNAVIKPFQNIGALFDHNTYTGNPPTGSQEETENPQGVFLKELETGDITFSDASPVYVFARLEARTLDKRIDVKVRCNTSIENEAGEEIEVIGVVDEDTGAKDITVPVFSGVERTIPCIFSESLGNPLPAGTYEIKYYAEFDFSADSSLKIYMMDRDRLINDFELLQDKGQEATKESVLSVLYGYQDTNPESIYTSGPLELVIGTEKVPWDIASTNNIKPSFEVAMNNLWQDSAKIESINNIYLKVPDTMAIQSMDCLGIPVKKEAPGSAQYETGYNVYLLQPSWTNINEFVGLKCPITIGANSLDAIPVTTRFLKAHVDFSYMLQETISVEVEESFINADPQVVIQNS